MEDGGFEAGFETQEGGQRRFQWYAKTNRRETAVEDNGKLDACQFFLIYERIDKTDENSPYFLKEYNFMHNHELNMTFCAP